MFLAVIAAFALNNWNDNRRDARAEEKILSEIRNGLISDMVDIKLNKESHELGIKSCEFFRDLVNNKTVEQDSTLINYYVLTGGNLSIMNKTGYEALKSKGLEILRNDSIRSQIITLYEGDYQKIYKLEETVPALQFFESFGKPIGEFFAPYMVFDKNGTLRKIEQPINLSKKEKNLFLSFLLRMQFSRMMILNEYQKTEEKVKALLDLVDSELEAK